MPDEDQTHRSKYNGSSPAQVRAVKKYQTEKVDRVVLLVPKGMKQAIKDHAAMLGQSSNQYCIQAIRDRMGQQDKEENTL